MLKKLTRGVCSVIGLVSGYAIAESLIEIPQIADLSYFSIQAEKYLFHRNYPLREVRDNHLKKQLPDYRLLLRLKL